KHEGEGRCPGRSCTCLRETDTRIAIKGSAYPHDYAVALREDRMATSRCVARKACLNGCTQIPSVDTV
ncbi:hypothetical protein JG688_00008146, partial [Phytophthora aleatoria]